MKELQVGDEIVVVSGYGQRKSMQIVERLTKTMIVTNDGRRFSKTNWQEVGPDSFSGAFLTEVTESQKNEIKRAKLIRRLNNVKWEELTDRQLTDVYVVVLRD